MTEILVVGTIMSNAVTLINALTRIRSITSLNITFADLPSPDLERNHGTA